MVMVFTLLCSAFIVSSNVFSAEKTSPPPATQDPVLKNSLAKGFDYLVAQQDKATGVIGRENKLASTSLAGMAFLSAGNLPGRGKYCRNLELAIEFVVDKAAAPNGYLSFEASNMYAHGLAMMFLAEAYGTIPVYSPLERKVRRVLRQAANLLEKCQGEEGGWWYNPIKDSGGGGSDISITVMETNALRAARVGGISVDKRVIAKAVQCTKIAQNADGGFSYRVFKNGKNSGGSALPRSAGAVCILLALGISADDPAVQKGLAYLKDNAKEGIPKETGHWYYTAYYLSQALFMSGKANWDAWWPKIREDLLKRQQADGSWKGEGGSAYGTAIALIVLQMPYRFLPLYQEGITNSETKPRE
jgi:hypothetical protein